MFSILIKQSAATAKLVLRNRSPYLLATFHASTPPAVWQMDLKKASSFTVSLRESEGEWDIGYTPADGDFVAVAHFEERGDAESSYASVQKALEQSIGAGSWGRRIVKFVFIVLVAAVLFAVISSVISSVIPSQRGGERVAVSPSAMMQGAEPKRPAVGEIPTGQPVLADDVLPQGR